MSGSGKNKEELQIEQSMFMKDSQELSGQLIKVYALTSEYIGEESQDGT